MARAGVGCNLGNGRHQHHPIHYQPLRCQKHQQTGVRIRLQMEIHSSV